VDHSPGQESGVSVDSARLRCRNPNSEAADVMSPWLLSGSTYVQRGLQTTLLWFEHTGH
jgi:hypothetical protein